MTEADLRHLIGLILDAMGELPTAGATGGLPQPRRALVVFTGAVVGCDDALASLRRAKDDLAMAFVQTRSAQAVLDQAKIAAVGLEPAGAHLTSGYDLLIVPTLTANTAAKAAYSMADGLAANLIMEYLLMGRPVVAASTGADPDAPAKRALYPNPAPGQAAVMRDNLRRLSQLGVHLGPSDQLDQTIRQAIGQGPAPAPRPARRGLPQTIQCPDRLVAAHHIQALPAGTTVVVRADAIVTHLALDLARQRSITLERS